MQLRTTFCATLLLSGVFAGSNVVFAQEGRAMQTEQAVDAVVAAPLTLQRVFASPSLNGPTPRAVRFAPDGSLVTLLKPRPDDRERLDLWAIDPADGREFMLVDSLRLGSGAALSEAEMMQRERARISGSKGIVSYQWSPDSQRILVPLDGDLLLASRDGTAQKLAIPAGALNPAISPKGGFVSWVQDKNLYVQTTAQLAAGQGGMQITPDGGAQDGAVGWGEAEFVAQEEMDRFTGHWWSPDDRRIAVARVDESPVEIVSRAAIGADGTTMFEQRYPRAGKVNALVDLYVMPSTGGDRVKVDLGDNPDQYLARVDWSADGSALFVQRVNRDQTRIDLLAVDPDTGASRVLFTEEQPRWINLHHDLRALKDGSMLWSSERSGYRHLYRWKNGRWRQLTRGNWVVTGVVGVDEAAGRVYFTGNRETPLESQVYWTSLNGGGVIHQISEAGFSNSAAMARGGQSLIINRSSTSQPPQSYLANRDGQRIRWIEENAITPRHPYAPYLASHVQTRFGTLAAADGTDLYYKLMTPPLEPGKRYPVFFEHYGGPHVQRVTNSWAGGLHQFLVDQGWIVFMLDNRGSYHRGKVFEDAIFRAMGGVEVDDQRSGAQWLKAHPFVDEARIATYGWSYGGYMTLKMLSADQGLYAAGVAGAPVTRWGLYDTFYTERYLDRPQDSDAYDRSSALLGSERISDPLLLIHGMADDNVLFDNTTALLSAMQGRAQPFEVMVYPGQTHAVGGPLISVHMWTAILDFLNRNVLNKD